MEGQPDFIKRSMGNHDIRDFRSFNLKFKLLQGMTSLQSGVLASEAMTHGTWCPDVESRPLFLAYRQFPRMKDIGPRQFPGLEDINPQLQVILQKGRWQRQCLWRLRPPSMQQRRKRREWRGRRQRRTWWLWDSMWEGRSAEEQVMQSVLSLYLPVYCQQSVTW